MHYLLHPATYTPVLPYLSIQRQRVLGSYSEAYQRSDVAENRLADMVW